MPVLNVYFFGRLGDDVKPCLEEYLRTKLMEYDDSRVGDALRPNPPILRELVGRIRKPYIIIVQHDAERSNIRPSFPDAESVEPTLVLPARGSP